MRLGITANAPRAWSSLDTPGGNAIITGSHSCTLVSLMERQLDHSPSKATRTVPFLAPGSFVDGCMTVDPALPRG